MLKKLFAAFAAILVLICSMPASAADCSAASFAVVDVQTGDVLMAENESQRRSIASTTKLLTALIACESGKLDDLVNITFDMVNTEGSVVGFRENDLVSLRDIVVAMMLASGNDAANAAAVYLGGSIEKFSDIMNKKAAALGMLNSYFVTPSGLDEGGHCSTAGDMALLACAAIKNPQLAEISKMKSAQITVSGKKVQLYNHNKLLNKKGFIGLKTGYTKKAGRCLVSAYQNNGKLLVCVTLNDSNDWQDHAFLCSEAEKMLSEKQITGELAVLTVGSSKSSVKVAYSGSVTVPNENLVTVQFYAKPFLYAPVKQGETVGKAVVKYKEKEIASLPLTAQEDVEYIDG